MSRVVHFQGSVEAQPKTATVALDPRSGRRSFTKQRHESFEVRTDLGDRGETACGMYCAPEIGGGKTTDAEVIQGEWDSLAGGNIFFTKNPAKVSCSRCLSAMPKRRAS